MTRSFSSTSPFFEYEFLSAIFDKILFKNMLKMQYASFSQGTRGPPGNASPPRRAFSGSAGLVLSALGLADIFRRPCGRSSPLAGQLVSGSAEPERGDRRWNRNPRPQPQTFSKLVFLIYVIQYYICQRFHWLTRLLLLLFTAITTITTVTITILISFIG